LASLIGQGMPPFDAACAAAHLHGRAGELAGEKLGRRCVLARDVIEAISVALRDKNANAIEPPRRQDAKAGKYAK